MPAQRDWKILTTERDRLGESPQWNSATGEFFWVDFFGPTIRRLSLDGSVKSWSLQQFKSIGSIVLCSDGRLLAGLDSGIYIFDPNDGSVEPFADPNEGRADVIYNDAKVDRHGNYWVGNFDATESSPRGILYVRTRRGEWHIGDSGFVVCNGPAFSPDAHVLYFNDSMGRQTLAYDLDPETGWLARRRSFQQYSEFDGLPDGCCVDSEGCVWVALYDGGKVIRLSPTGERVATLMLPVRNVTSCCLGGKDLRSLLVTSGEGPAESEGSGGAVFAIEVDVPGLPEPQLSLA